MFKLASELPAPVPVHCYHHMWYNQAGEISVKSLFQTCNNPRKHLELCRQRPVSTAAVALAVGMQLRENLRIYRPLLDKFISAPPKHRRIMAIGMAMRGSRREFHGRHHPDDN